MFALKDKTRSVSGEDKIRGLMGWLSYLDKLYKVRKFRPSSRIDREIPTEHYLRSAITAFWAGFFVWGYLVVSGGIIVYFRVFRKIKVTGKLFRSIVAGSYTGSFISVVLLLRFILSDAAFIQMDRWIDSVSKIEMIGNIFKKMLIMIFKAMVYLREYVNMIDIIYAAILIVSMAVYLGTRKIKENYV